MAFVVIYDANVLYPNVLRDVLIRVAQERLVQAKWTDKILDETFRNIQKNCPDIQPERLQRTRELMKAAIPDVLVTRYEPLIDAVELPDPDDRHVLAAAIRAQAQTIVTFNLYDFPADALEPWDIEAVHPDLFLEGLIDLAPEIVYGQIQRIADSLSNPPCTVDDIIDRLERSQLVSSAAALRSLQA
ncbi:PIN domain-containing protein [Streptomyces sp. NPDC058745]|uniref:PIN domain-containing protein n=1 Tax=Streptomyces sp. NPDC058745 TaxID=3346621 RepID=UPI0036CBB573